jgi:putative ATPase
MRYAKEGGSLPPPKHILNAPTRLMKEEGYGAGYIYDHSTEKGVSGQSYFPEGLDRQQFYRPRGRGYEREIEARLKSWAEVRRSAVKGGEKPD